MPRKPGELKALRPDVRARLMGAGLLLLAVLTTVAVRTNHSMELRGTLLEVAVSDTMP